MLGIASPGGGNVTPVDRGSASTSMMYVFYFAVPTHRSGRDARFGRKLRHAELDLKHIQKEAPLATRMDLFTLNDTFP